MFPNESFDADRFRPSNVVEPSASFLAALNDDLHEFDGYGDSDDVDGYGTSHFNEGNQGDDVESGQQTSTAGMDPGVGGKIVPYSGVSESSGSSLARVIGDFNRGFNLNYRS